MNRNYVAPLRVFAIVCAFAAFATASRADTTLNLPASADTTLFETFSDNNLGENGNFIVGTTAGGHRDRALIKFNLTAIPTNATITSVALTLVVEKAGGGPGSNFEWHRVLRDWSEGVGTGNKGTPANAGETTWNDRFHPATPWAATGAAAGTDYVSTASAVLAVDGTSSYVFNSTPGLVADVQMWAANTATNFGLILISDNEATAETARRVFSREDSINGPILTVQYTVPAPTGQLALTVLPPTNGNFRFSFNTESNHGYVVEYVGTVPAPASNWSALLVLDPAPSASNASISDPFTSSNRFYRARAL